MVDSGNVATIDETSRSAEPLGSRLEFETLISDLSARFINLPGGEVDGAIKDALRRVCEFLAIDYAVLWQWSAAAQDAITPTHAYPAEEGSRPPGPLRQEQYPWTVRQMQAGHMVVLAALEDLPAEAAVDLEHARLGGIKSTLCLPLRVGGESTVGALALNTLRTERDWPDALVRRLQLVAQVFANALARKRADEALRESEERLSLAADSAEAGLWTLDYSTGVFWATERARAIFGYAPDEVVTHGAFPGFGASRRLGPRSGSHRAVRACGRTRQRGLPDPDGRRRRALDRVSRATPLHVALGAGSPDGRLHRHHRAQTRRRGASHQRGSPGGGR